MSSQLRQRSTPVKPGAPAASTGGPKAPTSTLDALLPRVGQNDMIALAVLLVVTFCVRFYRLSEPGGACVRVGLLAHPLPPSHTHPTPSHPPTPPPPPAVVFDETHFGRFINQYHRGVYLFDIHPPLGKLVFYYVSVLFGYSADACGYANISDDYGPDCAYLLLRGLAALFSTFTAPVVYGITRNFGGSIAAALVSAAAFVFDGLNAGEGRLILMDSQLIFWLALCLFSAQLWWKRYNENAVALAAWRDKTGGDRKGVPSRLSPSREAMKAANDRLDAAGSDAPRFFFGPQRWAWLVWMGLVTSNCVAIKWTGLATPAMVGLESLLAIGFLETAIPFWELLIVLAVAAANYTWYFVVHFALMPKSGDGDAFMKIEFQRKLIGNPNYDPLADHPGFWPSFFYLNAEMLRANARIQVRHAWESKWWEWPLNMRGILYYARDGANVYLLGNSFVLWPLFVLMMFTVVFAGLVVANRPSASVAAKEAAEGVVSTYALRSSSGDR